MPLPFLSTHVSFDEQARDLTPATDVTAFDVPSEVGPRHKITVFALDGARAQGYVLEQDGVARPDSEGLTVIFPDSVPLDSRTGTARPARPIGTVHNGFTKLR